MSKQVSTFQAVVNAALANAKSDEALRLAFIAAGGNQEEPKRALLLGRVMYSLKCTQEEGLQTLDRKGRGKNHDDEKLGDDVRTVVEENACAAARRFLSSRLRSWGIVTTEARGGKEVRKGVMETEKLKLPTKPIVQTSPELGAWSMAFSKSGYDLFLLNKEHGVVKTDMGSELMGLFADFAADVAATVAKHAK